MPTARLVRAVRDCRRALVVVALITSAAVRPLVAQAAGRPNEVAEAERAAREQVELLEHGAPSPRELARALVRWSRALAAGQTRAARDSARAASRRAIALARPLGDSAVVGIAAFNLGVDWDAEWNTPGARDSAVAAYVAATDAIPDARAWSRTAHPLMFAAYDLLSLGRRDAARALVARLMALRRAAGDTADPAGVRALAGEAMQQAGARTAAADDEAQWLLGLASVLADLADDQRMLAVLTRLRADRFAQARHLDTAAMLLTLSAYRFMAAGDSAEAARALGDGGWAWLSAQRPDSALPVLEQSSALWRALRNPDRLASALEGAARALGQLGRPGEGAVRVLEAARLVLARGDSAQALVDLGGAAQLFRAARQFGPAGDASEREGTLAEARRDPSRAARAFLDQGLALSERQRFDSTIVALRRALPLARVARDSAAETVARLMLGTAFYRISQLDSAVTQLRAALALATVRRDSARVARAHNDLGAAFDELGRPDSALVHLRAALAQYRAGRSTSAAGTTSTNIGNILSHDPATRDSAIVYYRQGLGWQLAGGDTANAAVTLGNIGQWFGPERPDSAIAYYGRALALRRAGNDRLGVAVVLGQLGPLLARAGRPDSARVVLLASIAGLRAAGARAYEVTALASLGRLYHRERTLRDLARAVAYYDSAMTLQATLAASAGADADRVAYREGATHVFEDWALAWAARAREGVAPPVAARAALAVAERGRAQALLEMMRGASAARRAGASLADEALDVTTATARAGTALVSYFVTEDTLLAWVTAPGAEQGALLWLAVSKADVAARVARYRSAIGAGGAGAASRLGMRDVPLERVARGTRGVETEDGPASSAQVDSAARALAEIVFSPRMLPILSAAREVVIIPHGALGLVPFAALPLPGDSVPLGIRAAVRYAPSLAVLAAVERQAGAASGRVVGGTRAGAVVVGNPRMPVLTTPDGARTLDALPAAALEARAIAKRLGVAPLTDTAASEVRVRQRLPTAPLIHLATHGYAYATEGQARASFVALAPGGGADGFLTVGELLDDATLSLSAELVVLSACQTGLGDVKEAEGTIGLQRAFLARGAQAVLVSLWSVSDEATALLMQRFYGHWLDDRDRPSKAEALRRAQAEVRATKAFAAPRYWAGFQVVGR